MAQRRVCSSSWSGWLKVKMQLKLRLELNLELRDWQELPSLPRDLQSFKFESVEEDNIISLSAPQHIRY